MKNNIEYLDKISKIIEPPYFYELENYGITDFEEQLYILKSKLPDMNSIPIQQLPSKIKYIRDMDFNILYSERSNGDWYKWFI